MRRFLYGQRGQSLAILLQLPMFKTTDKKHLALYFLEVYIVR